MKRATRESGQAMIEIALVCTVLFMLTCGLVDVGRGIYEYNALASAVRYAARWGSVVGGQCGTFSAYGKSTNDWCNQLSSNGSAFWNQLGNKPLQANDTSCPTSLSSGFAGFYTVSDYAGTSSTTLVGAIAHRFDSNSSSRNFIIGAATPGFDLSQMKVCIQLPWNSDLSAWSAAPGDTVTVSIYYPFTPISGLITRSQVTLIATSEYTIE